MGQDTAQKYLYERVIAGVPSSELKKWKHADKAHYDVNCLMCNAVVRVTEKQLSKKFCGNKCKYASLALEHRGEEHFKRSGQWVECRVCGKRTWVKQSRIDAGKGKSCSRACYLKEHPSALKYPDVTRKCLYCDSEFTRKESDGIRYCTVKCSQLHSYDIGRHPPMNGRNNGMFGKLRSYCEYSPCVVASGRAVKFRSSYEIAFVQQYLDRCGLTWEYEAKTFDLGGTTYTPDFWVEELGSFVEVKGWMRAEAKQKLSDFRRAYPSVKLVVATPDVLKQKFGVDLSTQTINEIHKKHRIKSFVRYADRISQLDKKGAV